MGEELLAKPGLTPVTTLRLEMLTPATIHWTADACRTVRDVETVDTGLGVHVADLPTAVGPRRPRRL